MRERRRRVSLTGQLFVASLVLLTSALLVLGLLWTLHHRSQVEYQYEQRALSIARSVAATPQTRAALADGDDAGIAQAAEQGTVLELEPLSNLGSPLEGPLRRDVLLVVGNLVDNALQAVGEGGRADGDRYYGGGHEDGAAPGDAVTETSMPTGGRP